MFADETGAGIQLGPNATRALAGLGVLDAFEAVAFRPDLLRLFDEVSGGTLTSVPLGHVAEERYGAPYLTFHRADLHASLLAACKDHDAIDLRDGFDVAAVENHPGGVSATGVRRYAGRRLWPDRRRRTVVPLARPDRAGRRSALLRRHRLACARAARPGARPFRCSHGRALARAAHPSRALSRAWRQGLECRRRNRRRQRQAKAGTCAPSPMSCFLHSIAGQIRRSHCSRARGAGGAGRCSSSHL